MFFEEERIPAIRRMIMADTEEERREALAFLLPYQITTGGVTGIAAIIYYATGVEIQVSYFVINAVFLGFALKILGPKCSVRRRGAMFMMTVLLWL